MPRKTLGLFLSLVANVTAAITHDCKMKSRPSCIQVGPRSKAQAVGSLGDTSGASAVLELMQEARSRWTLTGLLSAWGADPVTIREAFPATGVDSTRDRIGCSWPRLDPIAPRNYRDYSPHKILSALCLGLALGRCRPFSADCCAPERHLRAIRNSERRQQYFLLRSTALPSIRS